MLISRRTRSSLFFPQHGYAPVASAVDRYGISATSWRAVTTLGHKFQLALLFSLVPAMLVIVWTNAAEPVAHTLSASTSAETLDLGNFLWHCAYASIGEEVIFRGALFLGLFHLLARQGVTVRGSLAGSALVSSLLFALAHELPGWEFGSPLLLTYRFAAGLYLSGITWTCGLGVAAGAHFCFNLALLLAWG